MIIPSKEGEDYTNISFIANGILSVITNVNASPAEAPPADESRTEDDGRVEGDCAGSLEELEKQVQGV